MTWWGWLIMFGVSAVLFAINEAPAVAYKRGYRAGVRAYRGRLQDVVSERDERRKHYPWRQPTGDQWSDRMVREQGRYVLRTPPAPRGDGGEARDES